MTASLILDRRDLDFLLYEWLAVEALTKNTRYQAHDRSTFDAVLDLCQQLATEHFAPHNRKSDLNEPVFDGERVHIIPEVAQALKVFADAGLLAAGQDEAHGGMQLPMVVEKAGFAWFLAANVATASYPLLTIANVNLLLAHASTAQIRRWARPQLEGRYMGTMCLSEPQAGSSLGDIRTRAELQSDGSYRLFGNKMWISAGEHELSENIVHLVLARGPGGAAGVKGLSLYIVPKFLDEQHRQRNDVVLAGINHKMGYRGTINTLLNFGEGKYKVDGKPGAVGYLVGEEGRGLACMFHMMNEARIGVGLGAAALGVSGYLHALDYARQRPQGRHSHEKDPLTPQVPIIEHRDVQRMLVQQKVWAEGALALTLYCARLVDEERCASGDERQQLTQLLDILTPIAKSWPAQWCLAANDLAIQVHGGYGYTRDYAVEQLYRDNRLNAIHEGSHGIQALDLLGRKAVMHNGAALKALLGRMRSTITQAQGGTDTAAKNAAAALATRVQQLERVTASLHGAADARVIANNATPYLEAAGHIVAGWIWLQLLLAASGKDGDYYRSKRWAASWYFDWELGRVDAPLQVMMKAEAGDAPDFAFSRQ